MAQIFTYLPPSIKQQYIEYQDAIRLKDDIAMQLAKVYPRRSKEILACCNTQYIAYNKVTGAYKVVHGQYCQDRLCPVCQQALHRERSSKLSFMAKKCVEKGYKLYFWTFSPAPNCELGNLKEASRAVINIFNRVRKQFFSAGVVGYWRTLEFTEHEHGTRNYRDLIYDDTQYHPHIHAVFAVDETFVTPYVKDVTQFIKDEVARQLKSKNKSYLFYKHLKGTAGIVYAEKVDTSNPGFAFELSKYISVSKNLTSSTLIAFAEQVKDLQCHRSTGALLWSEAYKVDYEAFIQNENFV